MEKKSKEYVLGFAFDKLRENVVLIEKNRPEWQKDKHNGVGGKVEEIDNSPVHAMVREFKEETGCNTTIDDWNHFAIMSCENDIMGGSSTIYSFRAFLDSESLNQCTTMESERVIKVEIFSALQELKLINKVRYLIPMALENDLDFVEIKMNK